MLCSLRGAALPVAGQRGVRRYATADAPAIVTLPVQHSKLYEAKVTRIGRALEDFKGSFEAPFKDLFTTKLSKTALQQRRLLQAMKSRMKTHRLKMKALKQKKQKVSEEKTLIKVQEEIARDLAKDPYTIEEFVLGARPPSNVDEVMDNLVKKLRDSFQIMPDERERDLERSDYWLEPSYLRASNPFPGIKMLETTRIRWELALQPSELAKWVARELKEKYRIPFNEDHPLLTSREAILGPSKVSKRALRPPFRESSRLQWFKKQQKKREAIAAGKVTVAPPPALADRPAVLAARPDPPMANEESLWSEIRTEVDSRLPVSVTTYHWPYIIPRGERFRMHQRKVVIKVHVDSLQLPSVVFERLKQLAGSRLNTETNVLRIVGTKKSTRAQNKAEAFALLRSLLAEAWKADVNFVPTLDPIAPHQKVERQLQEEAEQKKRAEALEPKNFVRPEMVVFRIHSVLEQKNRPASHVLERLSSL